MNSLLISNTFSASGSAVPFSQRLIACRDTYNFSAKSSCDQPLDFLSLIIFSAIFIIKFSCSYRDFIIAIIMFKHHHINFTNPQQDFTYCQILFIVFLLYHRIECNASGFTCVKDGLVCQACVLRAVQLKCLWGYVF